MYDEELTFKEFIHKRSVIVLSVLMLICLVFNACRYIRTGLYIGVDTFVVKKNDEYYRGGKYEVDVDKQRDRTKYKFTCGNMNRDLTLFWKDGKAIITFADGAKVTGYLKDGELVDEEGEINNPYSHDIYFDENVNIQNFPLGDYDLAVFACRAYKGETERYGDSEIQIWLCPIVTFIMGLLGFYFPNNFNFFGPRWQYKKPELTEEAIAVQKLIAIFFIMGGYAIIFFII